MSESYAIRAANGFEPAPQEPVLLSIFRQYEQVLVESIVTSFGLDFLVHDRHGGDVDTIHNVRLIRNENDPRQTEFDPLMEYKNEKNKADYDAIGAYDKNAYHNRDKNYVAIRQKVNEQKRTGTLKDPYTGKLLSPDEGTDLEHMLAASGIHKDPGRVLAGLSGTELANCEANLRATNSSINRSKNDMTGEEYIAYLEQTKAHREAELARLRAKKPSELTEKERRDLNKYEQLEKADPDQIRQAVSAARKDYEAKVARAYYTSPRFIGDTAAAAGRVGAAMGARQALGFVFMEVWFAVKEEFRKAENAGFDFGDFLHTLGNGVKRGMEQAKKKYKEVIGRFFSGTSAGILSSLTTTICNIFFTTAKNVVRIIRQCYASLVKAGEVLFINPDNYTFGERMRAVVKILATGASVVVGVLVSEAVSKTGIDKIPVIGDIVPGFCGTFVTGIMSCTLLYFLDRSELMNRLFHALDGLHTIETEIQYYRRQADYFERYAAGLMQIDLEQFQKETALYGNIADRLEQADTEESLNLVLQEAYRKTNLLIPWAGHDSFEQFMQDEDAHLVFS